MKSLVFRNLIFIILQPGLIVVILSYLILKNQLILNIRSLNFYQFVGIVIFIIGLVVMLYCIYNFVVDGLETLSPADPTKKLVMGGLYKYSRNPMYLGVI